MAGAGRGGTAADHHMPALSDFTVDRNDLTDGVYRLNVQGGTDLAGNIMTPVTFSGDTNNGLYGLLADFNGDGAVSIFDFNAFVYWFGD